VKILAYLFILLSIVSPWFSPYTANHAFVKMYTFVLGIIAIFIYQIWKNRQKTQLKIHLSITRMLLLALFLLGTLSLLWSVNLDFSITKWTYWFASLLTFLLATQIQPTHSNLLLLSKALITGTTLIAIIGVSQFLFGFDWVTQAAPPASTFGNKNMAAQIIIMSFPLTLFLLFSYEIKQKQLYTLSIASALMLSFLFYTSTRASWLGFIFQSFLIVGYLIIQRKKISQWIHWNRTKTKSVLLFLLLTFTLVNFSADGFRPFWKYAGDRFDSITEMATPQKDKINPRYKIWEAAYHAIQDKPILGFGLGTFYHNLASGQYATAYATSYQRAHNDLIELMIELGAIGVLIFIAVIFSILSLIIRILRQVEAGAHWFYYLLLVSLAGSALNMQFSFPYQMAVPLFLFPLFVGLIVKRNDELKEPKSISIKLSPILKNSLLGLTAVLFAFIIFIYQQWITLYNGNNIFMRNEVHSIYPNPLKINLLVYHMDLPTQLHTIGSSLFGGKRFKQSLVIENQVLNYWENDLGALFRKGQSLTNMRHYTQALKTVKKLKKAQPEGIFFADILEIMIYIHKNDLTTAKILFKKLAEQPERLLKAHNNMYKFLFQTALSWNQLDTVKFYQKYNQFFGYSCLIENNMAIFYLRQGDLKSASEHIDIIEKESQTSNNKNCTNSGLLEQVKSWRNRNQ
jgi:O-antigen ligase